MHSPSSTTVPFAEERRLVADACRILANEGLTETTLGHVSLRVGEGLILVRARGQAERGLLFSTEHDVVLCDLDGALQRGEADVELPSELPIHTEVLRSRPDLAAVVHAHPPEVVLCTVTDTPLRPIVGAYNLPAMWLAIDGIPTYRYAGLIRNVERARGMLDAMGKATVCLLQGHGLTAGGASVEEATLSALNVTALARITVAAASMQRPLIEVDPDDYCDMPRFSGPYFERLWRFYCAKLDRADTGVTAPSADMSPPRC